MNYQEEIAIGIVLLVLLRSISKFFREYLAAPLSIYLLKLGYVKWAIWVRKKTPPPSVCLNCK